MTISVPDPCVSRGICPGVLKGVRNMPIGVADMLFISAPVKNGGLLVPYSGKAVIKNKKMNREKHG